MNVAAQFSAPKIPGGLSAHEFEMLQTLMRKGREAAVRVYIGVIRKGMDRDSATAGDRVRIDSDALRAPLVPGVALDEVLGHLRQARLIKHLPAPPGRFRFFLPLVDRC